MNNTNLFEYGNQAYCFTLDLSAFRPMECFSTYGFLDFSSDDSNIRVGDDVYLYAKAPFKSILAKCKVERILSNEEASDESLFIVNPKKVKEKKFYVRLKLIQEYLWAGDQLSYHKLKKNGLTQVRSQHRINTSLRNYINSI